MTKSLGRYNRLDLLPVFAFDAHLHAAPVCAYRTLVLFGTECAETGLETPE